MIFFFYLQAPFTGGEDGIQAVPRHPLFGVIDISETGAMYALVLAIFLFGFGLIWRIVHSPFGQVLKAIRELAPDLPVIMISGNELATEQFYAQRIGADDFMKKPFSRSEVFMRIEKMLGPDRIPHRQPASAG